MQEVAVDGIDLRILDALQRDGTLSTNELADKVGLSQSSCWRRLDRLKAEGVILDGGARLDRRKLGFHTLVFAHVKLAGHGGGSLTEFADRARRCPEVQEAYALVGDYDYLLRVVTRDMEAYETFVFETLSRLPGVHEINSMVALSEVKSTTALPLLP